MKLIKPSFSIWEQEPGLQGIYKQIEKAAKVCYKSEGNITEDSAKPFIDNVLLKRGHLSPLEHGTVYLYCKADEDNNPLEDYFHNPYSKAIWIGQGKYADVYVTTNMRVLVEHNCLDDLKYLYEPTEFHEKRISVHFTCNRGVWNEFIRHRALARTDDTNLIDEDAERLFSFSQESQRYCNYSKNKFGNEVTFIIPCWCDESKFPQGTIINHDDCGDLIGEYYYHLNKEEIEKVPYFHYYEVTPEQNFVASLQVSEQLYFELLNQGWKPQQAREVLPNACKTELVMTGFVSQWKDFFLLRSNKYGKGGAHPSADELVTPLYEEFIKRDLKPQLLEKQRLGFMTEFQKQQRKSWRKMGSL